MTLENSRCRWPGAYRTYRHCSHHSVFVIQMLFAQTFMSKTGSSRESVRSYRIMPAASPASMVANTPSSFHLFGANSLAWLAVL